MLFYIQRWTEILLLDVCSKEILASEQKERFIRVITAALSVTGKSYKQPKFHCERNRLIKWGFISHMMS